MAQGKFLQAFEVSWKIKTQRTYFLWVVVGVGCGRHVGRARGSVFEHCSGNVSHATYLNSASQIPNTHFFCPSQFWCSHCCILTSAARVCGLKKFNTMCNLLLLSYTGIYMMCRNVHDHVCTFLLPGSECSPPIQFLSLLHLCVALVNLTQCLPYYYSHINKFICCVQVCMITSELLYCLAQWVCAAHFSRDNGLCCSTWACSAECVAHSSEVAKAASCNLLACCWREVSVKSRTGCPSAQRGPLMRWGKDEMLSIDYHFSGLSHWRRDVTLALKWRGRGQDVFVQKIKPKVLLPKVLYSTLLGSL